MLEIVLQSLYCLYHDHLNLKFRSSKMLILLRKALQLGFSRAFILALVILIQTCFALNDEQSSEVAYKGVDVGFTEEGYPFMGEPDAPVTIIEYSDYLCPFCGRHFEQTQPQLIENYVSKGKLKMVFRDFPIAQLHSTAFYGHIAASCVGEQGPRLFWEMHDELFSRQREWNTLTDPSDFLRGVAESLNVDIETYETCIASEQAQARLNASLADVKELNFSGTPSFQFIQEDKTYKLVGAQPYEVFSQWIEALLEGKEPPKKEEPEPPELPYWANEEQGLLPDVDNPGFTMAGDPYKGSEDAPLTVVEFSDFQCPFCAEHTLEVQPILDETFVDTGQVRWVFKHFPLRSHQYAVAAATATECAAKQGLFWELHDLLFETQEDWSAEGIEDIDAELIRISAQLEEINLAKFASCLGSRKALEDVLIDIYDASGAVSTTPTFIVIHDGQGRALRGLRKAENFSSILEDLVDDSSKQSDKQNSSDDER